MSELLSKIESINRGAAHEFRQAGLLTDSAIKSLSRDDLRDLFPGNDKFQMRRSIYEIIHKPEPVDAVFKELREFVPHESLLAALKNEKVLDYLNMLKEMKAHAENILGFFQAQIDNLEEFNNAEPQQKPDKDSASDTSSSIPPDSMDCDDGQNDGHSQGAHAGRGTSGSSGAVVPCDPNDHNSQRGRGSKRGLSPRVPPQRVQVMYRSVVSGKTFGADVQLMSKVEQKDPDRVRLVERRGDHEVTVLFCPISSRVGADVDAAMSDVEGDDKDIILVLMHHVREPKATTNIRTWNDYKRVVLHVHVFYHETNNGLLSCQQNDEAVFRIQSKLLNYSFPICQATSGNALGVGEERGHSTNRGGNNSSDSGKSSSMFRLFFG